MIKGLSLKRKTLKNTKKLIAENFCFRIFVFDHSTVTLRTMMDLAFCPSGVGTVKSLYVINAV